MDLGCSEMQYSKILSESVQKIMSRGLTKNNNAFDKWKEKSYKQPGSVDMIPYESKRAEIMMQHYFLSSYL